MNVSEFLLELGDLLEDATGAWPPEQLLRYADRHQRGLARTQSSIDNSYHNCEVNLLPSGWVKRTDALFEYAMRQWVLKPTLMWERASNVGDLDEENPWNLENADLTPLVDTVGNPLPLATSKRDRRGWLYTKSRTVQLMGFAEPKNLMAQVNKLPSRLFKATLDVDGLNDQEFFLPASLTLGTEESEVDAYRNAIVEFRTDETDDENHRMAGEIRVVAASLHNEYVDGVRHTRLKLDRPLPHTPRLGDKLESVFEVADESMLYLILLCARSAWTKRGMFKSVGAIGPNLAEQHREFVKHNQPRQQQEPKRIRKSLRRRQFGFGRASFELDNTLLYI